MSAPHARRVSSLPRGTALAVVVTVLMFLALGVLAGGGATSVVAEDNTTEGVATGEADLEVSLEDRIYEADTEDTLELFLTNTGEVDDPDQHPEVVHEEVTMGRDAVVNVSEVEADAFDVEDEDVEAGNVSTAAPTGPVPVDIDIPDDTEPGRYNATVNVTYTEVEQLFYEVGPDGELLESSALVSFQEISQNVTVQIDEHQRFEVVEVDHDVQIGDRGTIEYEIENTGDYRIRDIRVTASVGDGELFFGSGNPTSEAVIEELDSGERMTIKYDLGTNDPAVERFYGVDLGIQYENPDLEDDSQDILTAFMPYPQQEIAVESIDHDVRIGDDGLLEVVLRNDGPRDLTATSISLSGEDGAITFGSGTAEPIVTDELALDADGPGSPTSEAYVDEWASGETVTVVYRVAADDDALEREYTLNLDAEGEDGDDREVTARSDTVGFVPLPEQTFALSLVESSIRVGSDGTLVGELENTGDVAVHNVETRLESEHANIHPRETRYAHGTVEPGETVSFELRIGVSDDAEPGPRNFEFTTRYRNPSGDERLSDSQDLLVDVGERVDEFALSVIDPGLAPGEGGVLEIEVENSDDDRLENIRAKLFTSSPIGSDDDEAFIDGLDPGERTTVVFEVDVDSGALAKTYPVSMDFRYEDERGDTQLSRTYRLSLQVSELEETSIPIWAIALPVVVVVGLLYWYRRPIRQRIEGWRGSD